MEEGNDKTKWVVIGGVALACIFVVGFLLIPRFINQQPQAKAFDFTCVWTGNADHTTWENAGNWNDCGGGYPDNYKEKALINTTSDSINTPAAAIIIGELDMASGYTGTLSTRDISVSDLHPVMEEGGSGKITVTSGTLKPASSTSVSFMGGCNLSGGTIDLSDNPTDFRSTLGSQAANEGLFLNSGTFIKGTTTTIDLYGGYTDSLGGTNIGIVRIDKLNLGSNIMLDSISGGFISILTTNGYDVDCNGELNMYLDASGIDASSGAGGDSTIRVSGDVRMKIFTSSTSTFIFDGTSGQTVVFDGAFNNVVIENTSAEGVEFVPVSSPITINRLIDNTPGSKISFNDTVGNHVIANEIDINGEKNNEIKIRSTSEGSAFPIDVQQANPTVEHVDVKDSNASSGNEVVAINSIDSTGNTNWAFLNDPDNPTNIVQKSSTGETIPNGGTTSSTTITYQATVTDNNADQVQLCVETKPAGTSFSNSEDACSSLVPSGSTASVTSDTIRTQALSNGSYHWQSRAKDAGGRTSGWESSGTYTVSTTGGGDDTGGDNTGGTTDDTGGGGTDDTTTPGDDFGTVEPEVPTEKVPNKIDAILGIGGENGGIFGNLDRLSEILGAPMRALGISDEYVSTSYATLGIIISGVSGLAGPISNSLVVPSYIADLIASGWNSMLVFFGFRARRKKNWGKVIEAGTGMPVAQAIIKLIRHEEIGGVESKQIFATTHTDKDGDYRFIVPPGKYSIDVSKRYYDMIAVPQKDFYKPGNIIEVKGYEEGLVKERIAMSIPQGILAKRLKLFIFIGKAEKVMGVVSYVALVLGSIIAINGVINHFGALNLVIGLIYILLWTLWIYSSIIAKKYSPWGESLESKTKAPVDLVLVRILSKQGRLIRTVVTDAKGKYSAILRRARYEIKAVKSGYLLNKPITADVREEQGILKRKIWLDKTR